MRKLANHTEKEILETIERVIVTLVPSFIFGYYTYDDIAQEARIKAIEALDDYDEKRRLDCFLWTHVKNRLINLRRDKQMRNDPPCNKCHAGNFCKQGGCKKYNEWYERNIAKCNVLNFVSMENLVGENNVIEQSDQETDVQISEILKIIDEKIPVDLRKYYLMMRDGVSVPKSKRLKVEEIVKEILKDSMEV